MKVGVLLLAAGRGQRFGADKRLALYRGKPLLEVVVASIRAAGLPLRVCLKPDDSLCEQLLTALEVEYCYCSEAQHGMGHTLAQGIQRLPDWDATLVALADMPWIDSDSYRQLADAAGSERIVAPIHGGQRGHPVAFGRRFYPQLEQLEGDEGARHIIAGHPEALQLLPLDDPGVLRDVDHPHDLDWPGS
ncbi:nucleotidyltransferase family protein [Parahaliea aestuarii]|uniref:Nucleotidyltransferase family protein n=1 Tax=Parahaliea aestuarii TaxID=1852021 RepID=A0A5C8ZWA5_9GAMM|nr:nucleotidyltransferase family protein [Parahaliea aestuarii]TXS91531.1 nucleotidyltransferase family protein [Parahaliea aestuarii]